MNKELFQDAVSFNIFEVYKALAELKLSYFRISTGELTMFSKDSKLNKEQKAQVLKERLSAMLKQIKDVEKSISAYEKFEKTLK